MIGGPRAKRVLRLLSVALLLVLVGVAVSVLRGRWQAVDEAGGLPGLGASAAAVLVYLLANVLLAWNWRAIVALAGPRVPIRSAVWIWSISQISRYTMAFAQIGSRAVVARRYGVPATAGVLSTLFEIAWMLTVTCTIVLATVPFWLPIAGDARWVVWVAPLPVAAILFAVARPRAVLRGVDALVRVPVVDRRTRGRFAGVATSIRLDRATMGRFVLRYGLNTVLRHGAFLIVFAAVGGDLQAHALTVIGLYALGSLVGTLAVFAPGGLGVREGIIAVGLTPVLGGGAAVLLVVAVRLLELIGELGMLGAARVLRPPVPVTAGVSTD
jgi:glycosyltransferase 2 family protein